MNMQNTGAFIQASRKRLNISRQALGKSLSVTDQTVADWESGLACPGMEDLKNMALLFHCSITDMVNGTPDSGQSGNLPSEMPEDVTEPEDFSCPVNVALDYTASQAVSPLLFGDNLEHTRGCIYGGLSAELLRNRKFVGKPGRYHQLTLLPAGARDRGRGAGCGRKRGDPVAGRAFVCRQEMEGRALRPSSAGHAGSRTHDSPGQHDPREMH